MSTPSGKLKGNYNNGLNPLFHDPKKIGSQNKNDERQANEKMGQQLSNQQLNIQSGEDLIGLKISSFLNQLKLKQKEQQSQQPLLLQRAGQQCQGINNIVLKNAQLSQQKQQLEEKINIFKKQQQKHDSTVKQLNQKIKTLTQSHQKSIKLKETQQKQTQQQRRKLIDQIKIYLGQQDEKKINGNFVSLITHQTILAQVKELGQKLVENKKSQQKQRQFLNKTFDHIVNKFQKVKTQNFISSGYKQGVHSFFKETVEDLSKKIINNTDMNVPNKEFYRKLIDFLSQVNTKVDEILYSWNGQLTITNSEIKDLLDEKERLKRQIEEKQDNIRGLQSDNQSLNLNYNTEMNKVKNLTNENQQLKRKKSQLETQIKDLKSNLQKKIEELIQKNQQLIKTKQTHEKQKLKLNNQIQGLKNNVKDLQKNNTQLQADLNKSKREIIDLENKISKWSTKLKEQQKKSSSYQNKVKELTKTIERLNEQIQRLKDIISQKNKIINNQHIQISQLKQKYLYLDRQYQKQQQKTKQLRNTVSKQLDQIQYLDKIPKFVRCYAQYFNGNILNYKTTADTEWFVNNIETYMNRKILSTKFLYRLDPENRNSFHNYIDCIPHLVVIVKHANGQIIGAYSQAQLEKGFKCDLMKGLMVGFKNRAVFHVKTQSVERHNKTINPRPVTWDEHYIIFGNSDLRIIQATPKADNLQIYSNYATSSCSYEERNKKGSGIQDLFTEDNRKGQYVDFEVFSIIFQQ